MSYGMFGRLAGVVACMAMLVSASGCMPDASAPANRPTSGDETDMPLGGASRTGSSGVFGTVTAGTDTYRGFVLDNVLHSPDDGDIHFNLYVPDSYDGSRPVALFLTLPGYQGLYFQGVGENLYTEDFGFEAQRYNDRMIIAAPQLSDWGETMSRVMGMRPDLFSAYLHCSSQWDGDIATLAESETPVYLVVGQDDEYYGSEPSETAYDRIRDQYKDRGLSERRINELVTLDVKDAAYFANQGITNQHGGGGTLFSHDPDIMGWLFNR